MGSKNKQVQRVNRQETLDSLPDAIRRQLNEMMLSPQAPQNIIDFVLKTALDLLGAPHGSLRWVNYRSEALVLKALRSTTGASEATGSMPALSLTDPGILAWVVHHKQPCRIDDLNDEQWRGQYTPLPGSDSLPPMRSELAVPLFSDDGKVVVGVLNVESPRLCAFTLQHQKVLVDLAHWAQQAVPRAQFDEALETMAHKALATDPEAFLAYIVEALADLLHVPVCSLWLRDPRTTLLQLRQVVGRPTQTQASCLDSALLRESFLGEVFASRKVVYIPHISSAPKFLDPQLAEEQGWISTLAAPICTAAGEPLGVISVYSKEERLFTAPYRKLVMTFAQQVATSLQQVVVVEDKDRQAKALAVTTAILGASVSTRDVDALLCKVVELIHQAFHYRVDICVVEQKELALKATGLYDGTVRENVGDPRPVKIGLVGVVASTGEPVVVPNVAEDSRYRAWADSPETCSELAVPLRGQQGQLIGVLNVESQEPYAFSQNHLEPFETIAAAITQALELARRLQACTALQQLSTIVCHARDLSGLCTAMNDTVLELFAADAWNLYLETPDGQGLERVFGRALPDTATSVWQSGHPLVAWNLVDDPGVERISTAKEQLRSAMVVPIRTPTGVQGALGVLTSTPRYFAQHEVAILEVVGNSVALTLEKVRAETEQRRLTEEQAQRTIVEQMDLVGGVLAHKMAGFLGAISLTANQLAPRIQPLDLDDVTCRLTQGLRTCGRTADRLVAQLRGMQKATNHAALLEAVALEEVVQEALWGIDLPAQIARECTCLDVPLVRANRDMLILILQGMIENALDAMPGRGTLGFHGEYDRTRSEVCLYVSDTGQGLLPKVREKLFNTFVSTKMRPDGGFGVGLFFARWHLRLCRGDLAVSESSEKGTTFVIRLPKTSERISSPPGTPTRRRSPALPQRSKVAASPSNVPCVLLVEDEPYWQDVWSSLLMAQGWRPQIVNTAEAARRLLLQQTFGAFVVDVRLVEDDEENMDGLKVVEAIRTYYPWAPILICSVWEPALTAAEEQFGSTPGMHIVDKMDQEGLQTALVTMAQQLAVPRADVDGGKELRRVAPPLPQGF